MVSQLILSLSILVVLHELGHFAPAKWFKTKVEKFYLFFDIKFSLFKHRIGETEYGIGWLPLGGYVKIAGMVDESMDLEQMKQPPEPWEFRSKPAWQRLVIMIGGVTVNFLLGFFIFGMMLWGYGKEYLRNDQLVHGIYVDSLGTVLGLRDGDRIRSIGDQPFSEFNPALLRKAIVLDNATSLEVQRGDTLLRLPVDPAMVAVLANNATSSFLIAGPRIPFVIGEVTTGSAADKAGLQAGDEVISIDSIPAMFQHEVIAKFRKAKGQTLRLGIRRNGQPSEVSVSIDDAGRMGVALKSAAEFGWTAREEYSLGRALSAGVRDGIGFIRDWFKGIAQLFRGQVKARDSLGGFISITKLFSTSWDWESFWRITAILSFILAIMNLLPIPALDGGHVMFLLWEVVTGRKPSDKFMEVATYIGFAIVLALLIFANGLDILRLFGK